MHKLFHALYQPYKWLFLLPFFVINSVIFGVLAVISGLIISKKVAALMAIGWARLNIILTPMFVTVKGRKNIEKGQSYVIVANHQSAYDIFLLNGYLGIDYKWIMKKEISKIPGVGIGSKAIGHIFIDRSNSKVAMETIKMAKSKIKNGVSVLFFPEGTRTETGELLPFKKGAFRFALDIGLPVLPVTIRGTRKVLPSPGFNIFPGKAEMIINKPIDINNYSRDRIVHLMNDAKKIIQEPLQEIPEVS